jgi:hypothetical protein
VKRLLLEPHAKTVLAQLAGAQVHFERAERKTPVRLLVCVHVE